MSLKIHQIGGFLLFIFISLIFAADNQLCDLIGSKNIISNDTVIECIDFEALHNDTVTVYGDVSSISKNGLALCPLIDIEVENPDIVYVLDQSWSMPAKSIVVYEDTQDTVISHNGAGALNKPVTDSVLSPWENDFIKLPRLFNAMKNNNGTRANWAGDPFGLSAIALHKTLDYQAARSKTSTAGFCGLHKIAAHPFAPKPLYNNNLLEIKDSIFLNDYYGRTYFYPSLAQAKEWLRDTSICKNERQMIILISDGCPTKGDKGEDKYDYLNLLNENDPNYPGVFPPVYGVFLGFEGTVNYEPLRKLSDTTGGNFYIVPPDNPDSLVGVLRALIEKSFETPPLDISLTNTTIYPNQTSLIDENSVIQQADGSWQMIMDSALGLIPGVNKIDVEIKKSTWEGVSDTTYYTFYIKVAENSEDIDSSFEEICYDKVSVKIKNSVGDFTSVLTEMDTTCELYFNVYKNTPLSFFPVKMVTTQFHDTEFVTLHINDTSDENSDTSRLLLLENFLFLSNDTLIPTVGNNTIEASAFDTIILTWQNPRNAEDYLLDTIFVHGEKILFTATNAALFDTSENGAADLLKITFDKQVPKGFLLDHCYWNRREDSFDFSSIESISHDSNVITYKFENEYGMNLTSIPLDISIDEKPVIVFKEENKYSLGVDTVNVSDSIMVSPVYACVKFSEITHQDELDTLEIELSEVLMDINCNNFDKKSFRINYNISPDSLNAIKGYEGSTELTLDSCIKIDTINNYYKFTCLIDAKRTFVNRDATVYLNRIADLKDIVGNVSSRKGVKIEFYSQLYFTFPSDDENAIDNYEWPENSIINANLNGLSLTNGIDTLTLVINTTENDSETIFLIEDNTNSGIYKGQFSSIYSDSFETNNGVIEGVFDNKYKPDTTTITAKVVLPNQEIVKELTFIYKEDKPVGPTILYVGNRDLNKVNSLSDTDSLINILLNIGRDKIDDSTYVNIYTSKFHDTESVLYTLPDTIETVDSIRVLFCKPMNFVSCDTLAPIICDYTITTSANDTIFLKWQSKDKSGVAYDTVVIKGTPIVFDPLFAAAFDINNNGQVDQIKVKFDKDVPKLFNLESASWPNNLTENIKTTYIGIFEDSTIVYDFSENEFGQNKTSIDINDIPMLRFQEELFYNLGKTELSINDSVGAVPVSARLLKSLPGSSSPDTLFVNVSEAVKANNPAISPLRINGDIIFNPINPVLGYDQSKQIILESGSTFEILNDSNNNTIRVLSSKVNAINKGSVLYLNDSSSLEDGYNNTCGKKGIPLEVYGKLYFTKEGVEDSVILKYVSPFDSILVAVLDVESISDNVDSLILSIQTSGGDIEEIIMVETGAVTGLFKAAIQINFNDTISQMDGLINGKILNEDYAIVDTIFGSVNNTIQITTAKALFEYQPEPKIISAKYSYSDINSLFPDTLTITFNTKLSIDINSGLTSANIYDYWNGIVLASDGIKSELLEDNTIIMDSLNAKILIDRDNALVPLLDSIRFTSFCDNVKSSAGVIPGIASYCPITFSNVPPIFVSVVPNPIGYSEGLIKIDPPFSFNGINVNGALFLISSRLKLKVVEIVVLDMVGEIVYNAYAAYDNNYRYLYSIWDGKNKQSRVCGPGTYIANIKVTDINGNEFVKRSYIGIKDLDSKGLDFF